MDPGFGSEKTVHAIFANGMFHPTEPVQLPENCEVEFVLKVVGNAEEQGHKKRIEAILSQRFDSESGDLAERHNEHQP
ncbi:hypothetical protein Pla123a_21660 [Posidoniimonas polymericola]|uniref:DUF104 domain-containing protein n=1 Tax=Posidoniimonas polymericola TaxID=2528002 RepID=A0A5C5YRI8_9BACT|nr:antitoxin AF2212-like protein [Posidoniimonas polymericola]TWT77505.1 hypothetical protein Pla123a_21660 [Posidoniimonas polymericola]